MSDNQRAGAAKPHGSVSAATVVDAFALARQGGSLQGEVPLSRMTRAIEGLPEQPQGDAGLVRWSVRGEMGKGVVGSSIAADQPLLHLHVEAHPVLICQRCNDPFVFDVDSSTVLQLVKSEDELDDDLSMDTQDPDVVDSLPEKVVGSHRFDLLAQVEDELILSIPFVPKHLVCPGAQAEDGDAQQASATQRPSPFAVLEQLKRKD
ncbi:MULTISPECIES: DUF177 domain-containing protein [unclassified Bordetella]|uniref:YceD family protein n=1 Tax=unclassified Bordetella TaxID=2630031 RepID=UPI00132500F7|nr:MULTISPECIES: YceD family protein [unclassified Bordetella]MVW71908.1 DUF177 domain-containing protein [Bordetella sp. 15P40C-2]MVW77897.1 DUF177 domain-containing protein [Bordetella sp. 02P26C-1]